MASTGNKATTPFKTMDIKTALLSGGSRKRKASSSPQVCKTEVKNVRLSFDNEEENDIEILEEVCGIAITLDQSALNTSLGDCKENKDVNTSGVILDAASNNIDYKENKELNNLKEDTAKNVKVSLTPKLASPLSPKPTQNESEKEIEQSLSDKSKVSENSSCDELSTSAINSSINISLNTSGLTGDEKEVKTGSQKTDNDAAGENTNKNEVKEKAKKKKMTPAEAKKRAEEREQKQKEKLLKKQELENKKRERLLEKERREKEKHLRKEREELEKRERERLKQEKKEQEEKEKLMKQKEKEEKLQKKLEEQKKKDELKQKKEEELKKTEEEKLKKLEKEQKEKEKAERAKAAFAKFFVRGDSTASTPTAQVPEKEGAFLPFQVSDDMILAPVVPPAAQERFDRKQLDQYLECQDGKELYLQILKSGSYKDVRHRKRTQKLASSEADVIIIDKNAQAELGLCAKLLQFSENVRPPYWGTWRKKSKNIRPRNPLAQDEIFDYSVDSDDEWDEGGPGESLSGTEPEDESEDDYEVDNEFFVPHGYLSDEEEKMEDDDEEVNDPEKQKALLKIKLQEFEMERKKKTTELKPIILGCYFCNDPAFHDAGLQIFLQTYSAELLTETPIPTRYTIKKQQAATNPSESPKSSNGNVVKKKKTFLVPEEALPQLILHIHGNIRNRKTLAEEFQKLWNEQTSDSSAVKQQIITDTSNMEVDEPKNTAAEPTADCSQISIRQLNKTIKDIATYGKPPEPTINKCCWWVHESIREKYGLINTPFPNDKSYVSSISLKVEDKQLAAVKGASIKEFLSPN